MRLPEFYSQQKDVRCRDRSQTQTQPVPALFQASETKGAAVFSSQRKPPLSKLSLKIKRSLPPLPQRAQRAAGTMSDHRAAPGLLEKALAAPVRKAATELSSCSPLTVAILVNHNAIKYKEPAWGVHIQQKTKALLQGGRPGSYHGGNPDGRTPKRYRG